MRYMLNRPEFEGHEVQIVPSGWIRGPRLLYDGKTARNGPKRGEYILPRNDGTTALAKIRMIFVNPDPILYLDDERIELVKPLEWYVWIWCGLPLLLLFGGVLGGICGGGFGGALGAMAYWLNMRVFRLDIQRWEMFLLTGLISLIVGLTFIAVAGFLGQA